MVRQVAEWIARRCGGLVEVDDLVAYGYVGLMEARRRYDPGMGTSFDTYARWRVRGAIFDGLRAWGILKRRDWELARRRDPEWALGVEHATQLRLAEVWAPASLSVNPEASLARAELCARVRRMVEDLDSEDREVIEAAYDLRGVGDSASALARRRGLDRSSVCRRRYRAVRRLRRRLVAEELVA